VAITAARDSNNVQRAKSGNKTEQAQQQLQNQLRAQIDDILRHVGLTDTEYQRRSFVVSSDTASRRIFDSVVVAVTGAPLPGYAARAGILPVPPGPAGVHIGHVVNTNSTNAGLLPAAWQAASPCASNSPAVSQRAWNTEVARGHVITR
jgi:hypothetical protein